MDIAALEEIAARLRSGENCADEAADLIDDAIAELERLHRSVMVEKQWRQDAGDDAKRYRWLRDHIGETPLNPQGFASEICPDTRLKWELPRLVSTTCVGGMVSFDEAIDLAMAHTHNA